LTEDGCTLSGIDKFSNDVVDTSKLEKIFERDKAKLIHPWLADILD